MPVRSGPCWRFNAPDNAIQVGRAVREVNPDIVWFNIQFASFGDGKEESHLGRTAEKIQGWLAQGRPVFFVSPTPEDTARMQHLLAGYGLPARMLSPEAPLLEIIQNPVEGSVLFLREGKLYGSFVL